MTLLVGVIIDETLKCDKGMDKNLGKQTDMKIEMVI